MSQTRIETFGLVEFIGAALFGNPEVTPFHEVWRYFGEVADNAGISRIGKDLYGLQLYHPKFPQKFEMTYMACIETETGADVPIRMISKSIPKSNYVVQKVEGGISGIDDNLIYLYREYIPKNGLKVAMPIDFEKYCSITDHESVPEEIEIWVPVLDK
jgi:predicted transcriptional regulator YdeE